MASQESQDKIAAVISQLRKDCEEKGDEYAKDQLNRFSTEAKRAVAQNVQA